MYSRTSLTLIVLSIGCSLLTSACSQTNAAADSTPTVLECTQENQQWVTIAKRGNVKSDPLLVWNTTEFGDNYTPANRCKIVSEKLTDFVAANGGRL